MFHDTTMTPEDLLVIGEEGVLVFPENAFCTDLEIHTQSMMGSDLALTSLGIQAAYTKHQ